MVEGGVLAFNLSVHRGLKGQTAGSREREEMHNGCQSGHQSGGQAGTQAHRTVPVTFTVGLSSSVKTLWKPSQAQPGVCLLSGSKSS